MQNETEKSNTLVSKSLPMKPTIFISFLFSMSKAGRYVFRNAWSDACESGKYPQSPSGRHSSSYSTGQAAACPVPDSWHRRGTSPAGPLPAEAPEHGSSPRSSHEAYESIAAPPRSS